MPCLSTIRFSFRAAIGLVLMACGLSRPTLGIDYPGPAPGPATARLENGRLVLENAVIRATWRIQRKEFLGPEITDRASGVTHGRTLPAVTVETELAPVPVPLESRDTPKLQRLVPNPRALRAADREAGWRATIACATSAGDFPAVWSAVLRDNANAVRWEVAAQPDESWQRAAVNLLTLPAAQAHAVGDVDGSPIIAGNLFLAAEDPQADNRVVQGRVLCRWPFYRPAARSAWRCSAVAGVAPAGQMRRAFLYYLERERPRPYQPFLHYNSWYDIAWTDRKMNEAQCLGVMEAFGRELVDKRHVRLDGLVFDDGWDDNATLWRFHSGFPRGFIPLTEAARRYETGVGAWLSPWGGYSTAKDERLKYGRSQGFETNSRGFSLAGPKYYERFRDVCAEMVRRDGVNYFKYDGVGAGLSVKGAGREFGDDIQALLWLCDDLRRMRPDLYLSITTGTWPSPWWLWHGDSIWRNGNDMGLHGPGSLRQQWITYRDMITYKWIVRRALLYPLNSLMTQGIVQANLGTPARFSDDLKDMSDEIRSFFASGTQLQELYISPGKMTPPMWDLLAEGARWSRAKTDVLCDVHWVGGDPAQQQVYGWAAWSAGKGMLALRNPSPQPSEIALDIGVALELPAGAATQYELHRPWKDVQSAPPRAVRAGQAQTFHLAPFEVVVCDAVASAPTKR